MRLIDVDALKESIEKDTCPVNISYFYRKMQNAPTIDAEPVRHGHWVICSDGYYPYCSKCKQEPGGKNMTNYCPNCGAKMDEDVRSNGYGRI